MTALTVTFIIKQALNLNINRYLCYVKNKINHIVNNNGFVTSRGSIGAV